MSWDISILKFSKTYRLIEEANGDNMMNLGTSNEVRRIVSAVFSGTDWSDPAWGMWEADFGSVEFNLGNEDQVQSFMLHVRAGSEVVPLIVRLCRENGWQGLDCSDGDFIEQSDEPENGLNSWRAFRDRVIDSATKTDEK